MGNCRVATSSPGRKRVPYQSFTQFDTQKDGSGMIGLQEMLLLQTHEDELRILPAWPKDKDVYFRLHAPKQTIVEVRYSKGSIQSLHVWQKSRRKDVILPEWLVQ